MLSSGKYRARVKSALALILDNDTQQTNDILQDLIQLFATSITTHKFICAWVWWEILSNSKQKTLHKWVVHKYRCCLDYIYIYIYI